MPNFVCGMFLAPAGIKKPCFRSEIVLSLGGACTGYKPCLNMLEIRQINHYLVDKC